MFKKLNIYLNSAIYIKSSDKYVINSDYRFYKQLLDKGSIKLSINSMGIVFNKYHYLTKISDKRIRVNILFKSKNGKIKSMLNSFISFFKFGLFQIKEKKSFNYVSIPGNLPLLILLWLQLLNKKYGLYIRGDVNLQNKYIYLFYIRAIKKAEFCIVTGEKLFNDVLSLNKKVEKVHPMIQFSRDDILDNRILKKRNKFCFLYVGRFSEDKGIYDLLNSFNSFRPLGYDIELQLVGSPPPGELERFSNFYDGLNNNNIILKGSIKEKEELKYIYINADCFILPSHHEGFPRVLYEAMIFHLPIITSDLPGIRYEMKDNINCLKYPIGDISILTDLMKKIVLQKKIRNKISNEGIKFMHSFFKKNKFTHAVQVLNFMNTI